MIWRNWPSKDKHNREWRRFFLTNVRGDTYHKVNHAIMAAKKRIGFSGNNCIIGLNISGGPYLFEFMLPSRSPQNMSMMSIGTDGNYRVFIRNEIMDAYKAYYGSIVDKCTRFTRKPNPNKTPHSSIG